VLLPGPGGAFDEAGVAAGSVIALDQGPAPYVLYYSGRMRNGDWPGIGLAFSADSVHWTKQVGPIISAADYPAYVLGPG